MYLSRIFMKIEWNDRILTCFFIMQVFQLFIAGPLVTAHFIPFQSLIIVTILMCVFMIMMTRNLFLRFIALIEIVNQCYQFIKGPDQTEIMVLLGHLWGFVFLVGMSLALLKSTFTTGRITYHRILGSVVIYLNVALGFAMLYSFVIEIDPSSFKNIEVNGPMVMSELIYFSLTTLTTTGYGDILPVHPLARSLCNVEGVIGQLFPAILIARLVNLQLMRGKAKKTKIESGIEIRENGEKSVNVH